MCKTFAELGIPFSLFDAPSEQASGYCGLGNCSLCGARGQHCFRLGIGCAVMRACPTCGTLNGLDANDRDDVLCCQCQSPVPFPDLGEDKIKVCYSCLRSGNAAISKDTELGEIYWDEACGGLTHGRPGLDRMDFDLVPMTNDWVGARFSQEILFELLRTPSYITIQGEQWQFCCRRPMVFVGEWSREDFARRAPDGDGRRYFEEVVQDTVPGLWEDQLHDITGVYVFRCPLCERNKAHWDLW